MFRLSEIRKTNKLSQQVLADILGISRSTVAMWETGGSQPDNDSLKAISDYFNVSIDYLLGNDENNQIRSTGILIPVLGEVRCGIPIEAIQDILDYEEITPEMAHQGEHFGLRVSGDSMEPKFSPGDVVIVRKQPDVESGDFAVVYVDGDFATVKKIIKNGTSIMLVPLNNNYAPTVYTEPEIMSIPVTILGKVVELRAKFK